MNALAAQRNAATSSDKTEAKKDDGEPLDEAGLTPTHINMVMEHTNCSRNIAIQALRDNNDDMINAVMSLTKWKHINPATAYAMAGWNALQ